MSHQRVAVGADVASDKAFVDRAQTVGAMAVLTALYATNAAFKAVIDQYVASGAALAAAHEKVNQLEAQLALARAERDQQRIDGHGCHAAAVKQVEMHSATPADVSSYGFVPLEISRTGGAPPVGILVGYDHEKKVIDVHVQYPRSTNTPRCILEISADPIGAGTWHRIDGDGVKRALSGYAPGTWWIRAATSLATGRSDWFGPVSVIVS